MPIYRLFRSMPFDPEYIDLMVTTFETVSEELALAQKEDAIRDLVARAIIECAQKGIRDPIEMRRCAHEVLQAA